MRDRIWTTSNTFCKVFAYKVILKKGLKHGDNMPFIYLYIKQVISNLVI